MRPANNPPLGPGPAPIVKPTLSVAWVLCVLSLLNFTAPNAGYAQLAPGPYEILPFEDGCIIEGFKDLDFATGTIADWTGWTTNYSGWLLISPHAYDNHTGTDFSMQTGTPLFAAAAGTVSDVATGYPRNDHSTSYGNYVRIAVDAPSPNGEALDLTYCHMLSVSVGVGQHVNMGDLVGLSDNTGQSDSEHLHFMSELRGVTNTCPFYWAHFKYPILFNPAGTMQVGRVVRVSAPSAPIRAERFDTSAQITTAWQNQLFFSAYPKRGYYQVFIPNHASYRAGFIRATDVVEVFAGTVLQPLPDHVPFTHLGQLAAIYSTSSAPGR